MSQRPGLFSGWTFAPPPASAPAAPPQKSGGLFDGFGAQQAAGLLSDWSAPVANALSGPAHALSGLLSGYVPPTATANVLASQQPQPAPAVPQANALAQHKNSLLDKAMYATGVPLHARTFVQALAGRTDPITEGDLTPAEQQHLGTAIGDARANRQRELDAQAQFMGGVTPVDVDRLRASIDQLTAMRNNVSAIPHGANRAQAIAALAKAAGQPADAVDWAVPWHASDQLSVAGNLNDLLADKQKLLYQVSGAERQRFNSGAGTVQYGDYPAGFPADIPLTLGRFTYTTAPDGSKQVHDTYDFVNPVRREDVADYKAMNPLQRLTAAVTGIGDPNNDPSMASRIGNAYIGDRGIPVNIKLKPPR